MLDLSDPTPDFTQLSTGLGVPASRVTTVAELDRALRQAYAEPGPHLIEAIVPAGVSRPGPPGPGDPALSLCFDIVMTSPQPAFGDYQLEIYLAGLQGVLPSFPMAFAELEARAERALPPSVLSYVAGGAGSEHTQRANVSAFAQWGLIPRMFVGASRRDLSVELFGMTLPSPLLMAPIGVIGLCAQDGHGDLATASRPHAPASR